MRSLWQGLRPLVGYMAGFSFIINLLFLIPALFTLQVFDRVLPSNSRETLLVLVVGVGVALLLLTVLDYVRNRLQHVLGSLVDEQLSPPVVNAVVSRAARSPGGLRADGMRDVASLRNLFAANGITALLDSPWVFIYVAVIWTFHPALGIGAACCAIVMLALAWVNDKVNRRGLEDLQKETRRATQYIDSSLRNAEVLEALGMTNNMLDRWQTLQARVGALHTATSRSGTVFAAGTRSLRQAIQILMLALGAYLVLVGEATAGAMIATTILLGRAVQPVEQLVASWRTLADARAAYRRLDQLSDDFAAQAETKFSLPRPDGRLTLDGVSYRSPGSEKLVLMSVAFSLEPGEALAIIGPSAAGKSTLARLITGVWTPAQGNVRLDGVDVSYWPRQDLGRWIGYVPQDVELFDGTVAENISRLAATDSEAVVAAARRANAHDLIVSLPQGYDTRIGEQGVRLSPGQRQRIALARALFGDPRLVVLDEPNSNLDGAGEVALAQALSGLHSEGVTTVVITHRPSLIAHVDKILMLEAGRVQQFGPASEVMKTAQRRSAHVVAGGRA